MKKIVINSCHGGFNLSDEALEWLVVNKNWETTTHSKEGYSNEGAKIVVDDRPRKIFPQKYHLRYKDENHIRENKDIIEMIETIGAKQASGQCAYLKIVEIPDDIEWEIQEYDGSEWVAEKHRTWE